MKSNQSYLTRLIERYDEGGILEALKGIWLYIFYYSPLFGLFESVLGECLHEKLIRVAYLGYWPKIENPRTFNEKILHRKVYTDNQLYVQVSDKWRVRDYVSEHVGDSILNEVYYGTVDPNTIPFNELPEKFVIKGTHGTSMNIFVRNKCNIDINQIIDECTQYLNTDFGERNREYWYMDIEPRIIIEKFIEGDVNEIPRDYKFFVFNGKVEYIQVDFDRLKNHTRRFFTREWKPQEFKLKYPIGPIIDKPDNLEEMIEIAETLGAKFNFVRVDLYNTENQGIVFGEITIAHGSGGEKFEPPKYDYILGSKW